MTPAAVLFDLDGVLIDSREAIVRCIEHALRAHEIPVPDTASLHRWIGPPLIDAFAELAGPSLAAACLVTYRERYVWSSLEETVAIPGAREALAEVAARVPTALATTKPAAFAAPLCERLGFAAHLKAVVGPSLDAPDEVKTVTIARALSALGVRDAVMVGDRAVDVVAAHANRLPCVGVLWGIGDAAELADADVVVASPADLVGALGL